MPSLNEEFENCIQNVVSPNHVNNSDKYSLYIFLKFCNIIFSKQKFSLSPSKVYSHNYIYSFYFTK